MSKSHKNKVLKKARHHVENVTKNYPQMCDMDDEQIDQHFGTIFNEANFFKVWYYMSGYIDFDGCTDLGKWYMQQNYVTLCCKIYADFDFPKDLNRRQKLLELYDEMCAAPDYDDIDIREFSIINQRIRNQRNPGKVLDGSTAKTFEKRVAPKPAKGAPARQVTPESDDVFGRSQIDGANDDGLPYRYEECGGSHRVNGGFEDVKRIAKVHCTALQHHLQSFDAFKGEGFTWN